MTLEFVAAFGGAHRATVFDMVERIHVVAHASQWLGKLQKHRLQRVRLAVIASGDGAEDSHRFVPFRLGDRRGRHRLRDFGLAPEQKIVIAVMETLDFHLVKARHGGPDHLAVADELKLRSLGVHLAGQEYLAGAEVA